MNTKATQDTREVVRSFRLSRDEDARLRALARAGQRSLAGQLRFLIIEQLYEDEQAAA